MRLAYQILLKSLPRSGVTDVGARGRAAPPGKLNVKNGPPSVNILIFTILQFVIFLRFSGYFLFTSSVDIHDIQRFTIIS